MMQKTKKITVSAVLAALVFVTTAYVLHVPVTGGGYIHIGDAIIYLAASLLPTGYAMAVGAVGAGLCDAMFAPLYIIPTILIKAILTLFFTSQGDRILCRRNVLAVLLAGIAGLLGYYLFDTFAAFDGDFIKAFWGTVPLGSIQPLASAGVYLVLGFALDKAGIKKRLFR